MYETYLRIDVIHNCNLKNVIINLKLIFSIQVLFIITYILLKYKMIAFNLNIFEAYTKVWNIINSLNQNEIFIPIKIVL